MKNARLPRWAFGVFGVDGCEADDRSSRLHNWRSHSASRQPLAITACEPARSMLLRAVIKGETSMMNRTLGLAFLLGTSLFAACAADGSDYHHARRRRARRRDATTARRPTPTALQTRSASTPPRRSARSSATAPAAAPTSTSPRANRSTHDLRRRHVAGELRGPLRSTSRSSACRRASSPTRWTKLQASAATPEIGAQLLVRGKYVHGTNPLYPDVDWVTFQVTELWVAQLADGTVDGTFVMIRDNGRRCIDAPCHGAQRGAPQLDASPRHRRPRLAGRISHERDLPVTKVYSADDERPTA